MGGRGEEGGVVGGGGGGPQLDGRKGVMISFLPFLPPLVYSSLCLRAVYYYMYAPPICVRLMGVKWKSLNSESMIILF